MSFSLFSVAVLLLVAVFVSYQIARGIKRGFYESLIHVCLVLLSVVLSIIASKLLSDILVDSVYNMILSLGVFDSMLNNLPSTSSIIVAYCDAALTPFVFVFVYPIMSLIIRFVAFIVKGRYLERDKTSERVKKESASWIDKNQKLLTVTISALCGIFIASVFISPVMGSVKTLDRVFELAEDITVDGNNVLGDTKAELEDQLAVYRDDPIANAVYYCGGNIIYYANASSELNGNYFALGREIKNTAEYYNEILSSARLMANIDEATPDEVNELSSVGKYINKSESLKCITSDFVSQTAKAWMDGESFLGLSKPYVTSTINPVINKVLYVCSQTAPKYVEKDMTTLLELYILFYEAELIGVTDYSEMISIIDNTDFIERVEDILAKNPRMADISLDFDNMALNMISTAILDGMSEEDLDRIVTNISDVVNNVADMSDEDRIAIIKDEVYRSINKNGLKVSYDMVEVAAEQLVEDLRTTTGEITSDTIKNFFEKYSVDEE